MKLSRPGLAPVIPLSWDRIILDLSSKRISYRSIFPQLLYLRCSATLADNRDPSASGTRVVANIMFHDLVATPTPHDLLDRHRSHGREENWLGSIKEEMAGNVKEFPSEGPLLVMVQGFD
ncbi:MAG TPA: hypothetical protein VGS11_12575 [Candidatus Bathyarchaeia archaeon]|nr:hypothetical protein [Candidatus Bathyarchaeia archaeon]